MGRIINIKDLSPLAKKKVYEAGYNLETGERETTKKRSIYDKRSTVKTIEQTPTFSQQAPTKTTEPTKAKVTKISQPKETPTSNQMVTRTATLKLREGSGEQYLYYDTGRVDRVKSEPIPEMIRQGGKVTIKKARGAGGRPQIEKITPPNDWREIKNKEGEIIGYEGKTTPKTIKEETRFLEIPETPQTEERYFYQRGGQGLVYKVETTSTEDILRREAEKDLIKASRLRSEGKVGFFSVAQANIKKAGAGAVETFKKPAPYIVVAGATLFTTKNPVLAMKMGEVATPLYYGYSLSELSGIKLKKKEGLNSMSLFGGLELTRAEKRDPAELAGEGVALYTIAQGTQAVVKTAIKGIDLGVQNIKWKVNKAKFNKLEKSVTLNYEYKNLEGVRGSQRDLWGSSVSDTKIKYSLQDLNKNKIGFGIEQNPLIQSSDYFPTGQTKLSQDSLFAVDSLGNIRQTKVSGGEVFVKDPNIKKFVEFNPKHYSLITVNPNPSNAPKNIIPHADKSVQTELIKNTNVVDKTLKQIYTKTPTPKAKPSSSGSPTLFSKSGVSSTYQQQNNPLLDFKFNVKNTYVPPETTTNVLKNIVSQKNIGVFPLITKTKAQPATTTKTFQDSGLSRVNIPKINLTGERVLKASKSKLIMKQKPAQDIGVDQVINQSKDLFKIRNARGAQGQDLGQDTTQILGLGQTTRQAQAQRQVLRQTQIKLNQKITQSTQIQASKIKFPKTFNSGFPTPPIKFGFPKIDLGKKGRSRSFSLKIVPSKLTPKYQPTVKSIFFKETGKEIKGLLSGLEDRPIPIKKKKKKKRLLL